MNEGVLADRRTNHRRALGVSIALISALAGCDGGGLPVGLRRTPTDGTGPQVRWDLAARPLPEIPLPNDVATWPDPTSATGRRLNPSFLAPTELESNIREVLGSLDGWGTYAPITVAFDAPLDVDALLTRQGGSRYEAADWPRHAVYLVDLETGVPVPIDMNGGHFHYALDRTGRYYPSDPQALEANLLFESREEDTNGNGELDPGEDTDFDGVLDHPNTLDGRLGSTPEETYDRMAWFYERETNTLFLRPIIPLEERHEYAVVLTDRLVGEDGQAVRSPFPDVHHISQRGSLSRLPAAIEQHPELYGDLAGTGFEHVAFAWTFTTQTTLSDLVELRDGLYGRGRMSFLAEQFPPDAIVSPLRGGRGCEAEVGNQVYTVTMEQFRPTLELIAAQAFGLDAEQVGGLLETFDQVSHFVIGFYESPYLLGNPRQPRADAHFDLDSMARDRSVGRDLVPFVLVVPRETETHRQPFPVAMYGHGYIGLNLEGVGFSGMMARNGVATIAIDAEGHGFGLDPGFRLIIENIFASGCLAPMGRVLSIDRAVDLDGDATPDSGGNFWSAYIFHTRDVVRQSVLDHIQLVRILRHFGAEAPGGERLMIPGELQPAAGAPILATGDIDADGQRDPAGDFDGDGTIDVGGWRGEYHAWGQSLGGFLSPILAGVEPAVRTAAPTSGAGGLLDVGIRSQIDEVQHATVLRAFGPLVVAEPSEGPDEDSTCAAGQRSVKWIVPSVNQRLDIEIACLDADELAAGDAVVVRNLRNREVRCTGVLEDGRFRVGIAADTADPIEIDVYDDALELFDYATCTLREDAGTEALAPSRVIDTWEVGNGEGEGRCENCARYQTTTWEPGDWLEAPTEGFGVRRQSPSYRRFFQIAQTAVDPGDPVNYVRRIFLDPMRAPDWEGTEPRSLLVVSSIGDQDVPLSAGNAMARAAGILAFLPEGAPDAFADYRAPRGFSSARGAQTPNHVLVDLHVLEGISRLERHPIMENPRFLADVDDLSDGRALFTAEGRFGGSLSPVRSTPPLRWTRASRAGAGAFDPATGTYDAISGVLNVYVSPFGNHGTEIPDARKTWDEGVYYIHLVGRWFGTNGADLLYHSDPAGHGCLEDYSCAFFER